MARASLKIKESFGFEESERIILYAGRLSEDKGVYALINVFKKIHKEFPGTRLVLAGDGEFRELFPLCKEMSGKVSFLGNLGMNELQKLYSIAEIGVCPSFFELLGYTPIEMMANQLPVVISDVPGMRELVEDGVDGLVCGVRKRKDGLLGLEVDEESLYVKMRLLIKDKALAKKLALNGRKKWETQFTAEHMGQETYRLYQDVLSIGKKELKPVSKFNYLAIL